MYMYVQLCALRNCLLLLAFNSATRKSLEAMKGLAVVDGIKEPREGLRVAILHMLADFGPYPLLPLES